MGVYHIEFSCGHVEWRKLYGTPNEQQAKLAFYGKGVCPECNRRAIWDNHREHRDHGDERKKTPFSASSVISVANAVAV